MRIALVVLMLAGAARAEEPRLYDWPVLFAAEALIAADTLQSLDIKNHCHPEYVEKGCYEADPLVVLFAGQRPSDTAFITLGVLGGLTTAFVWYNLPQRWRWLAPTAIIAIEGVNVTRNAFMGLRIRM